MVAENILDAHRQTSGGNRESREPVDADTTSNENERDRMLVSCKVVTDVSKNKNGNAEAAIITG